MHHLMVMTPPSLAASDELGGECRVAIDNLSRRASPQGCWPIRFVGKRICRAFGRFFVSPSVLVVVGVVEKSATRLGFSLANANTPLNHCPHPSITATANTEAVDQQIGFGGGMPRAVLDNYLLNVRRLESRGDELRVRSCVSQSVLGFIEVPPFTLGDK